MNEETTVDDRDEFDDAFDEFSGTQKEPEDSEALEHEDISEEPEDNDVDEDVEEEIADSSYDWSSLPEWARKERDELEHSLKSNTGRVSALQKKINEYEEMLNGSEEEPKEQVDDLEEYYPEVAQALKRERELFNKELETRLQPLRELEQQRYIEQQKSLLSQQFPDWEKTVKSDEFANWFNMQPQAVQSMWNSVEANDYAYLLNGFNQTKSQKANDLQVKRERRLAANETIPNKGVSKKSLPPDDFDAAFEYYASR